MIDRTEILAVATDLGLSPEVVEKDYVIGWLLAGIYAQPVLAKNWIFKGGTCLKKCISKHTASQRIWASRFMTAVS
jgi:predicted nucleotidyltransferase component of viral defense system